MRREADISSFLQYGTVKKIEHFFKGISHDRTQISPVPPEGYGDRFIHFIKGITMSKEEAERVRESRALGRPSVERSSSVERTMLAAEREAAKEGTQTHAHPRTISTMRDPAETPGSGPASMLPIVDEAGEASSVGGHSQHSRHGPTADKDLPPLPAMEKGKQVAMDGPRDSYF